jgi:hypothetical protein
MTALLMALSLAFFAQTAVGRYGDGAAPSDPAATAAFQEAADEPNTTPGEAASAAGAASPSDSTDEESGSSPASDSAADAGAVSPITIGSDTPQPALAEGPAPTAAAPAVETSATPAEAATALAGDSTDAASPAAEPKPANEPKPADLMRALLVTPTNDQLAGVPLSLGSALRDATTRADQTERAQAYWDLSAAVAQYYLALLERAELPALAQGIAAPAAAWTDAVADAAKRIELTRQSAIAAQLKLHRLMGASASPSLPLPADSPHCGRYNTRYDEIFAARPAAAAAQLNSLLPLLHQELVSNTRLVADAHEWLTYVSEHRQDGNDGAGVLRSYQLMTERRRAFIEAARQYNCAIASYSELATPEQVGPDRLVAMLIRVSNGAANEDDIQQTSALDDPAAAQSGSDSAASNTAGYNAGAQDEKAPRTAWRPLDRLRNRERSIVTVRRKIFNALRPRE